MELPTLRLDEAYRRFNEPRADNIVCIPGVDYVAHNRGYSGRLGGAP